MAFSTAIKNTINRILAPANLRVETLTEPRAEDERLAKLAKMGHFDEPVFPLPSNFENANVGLVIAGLQQFRSRFATLHNASKNDVGYSFANDYFHSPDAEVFYTIIRTHKPARIIEVGSGHSTKIARQAIIDGKLNCRLISIDPQPRAEVRSLVNEFVSERIEDVDLAVFGTLQAGDILFIDSSHEVRIGNDDAFLYGKILPRIADGVLIQIHDIFLPYEYPFEMLREARNWNEQYVVQAMLSFSDAFEVIWPGYFLQRTRADFASLFPHNTGQRAQSLWLRKATAALH